MDVFGAAHAWGSGKHFPLPKIFHTYHTTMKLSTVLPYLKTIQEMYKSCETHTKFC